MELKYKKVLITGAAGTLGTELRQLLARYDIPYIATDRDMNVCVFEDVAKVFEECAFDAVIHCAGIIDVPGCEKKKQLAYDVNVTGAVNVAKACQKFDRFMVHISTDYVYHGDKTYVGNGIEGNYEVIDYLDPINYYAFTKVLADVAVRERLGDRCLVTRQSFKANGSWPYPAAFTDQYTSRDTVDVVADQILQAMFSGCTGIVHLGTDRKSVYELARRQSPDVKPIVRADVKSLVELPADTSLKLTIINRVL